MGQLVRAMLTEALAAMVDKDAAAVERAIATDKKINELDQVIEQQATIVLALLWTLPCLQCGPSMIGPHARLKTVAISVAHMFCQPNAT